MKESQAPDIELFDEELESSVEEALESGIQGKIGNMDDAVRYAYGLSETRKEIEEKNRLADIEVARWQAKIDEANSWRDKETKKLYEKASYMEGLLLSFHIQSWLAAPNDKAKKKLNTINLPYGVSLKSSQPQVAYEVKDEQAYLEYMEKSGFTVQEPPKVKWGDFKKGLRVSESGEVVTADGEVVDFLEAVNPDRKFEVK